VVGGRSPLRVRTTRSRARCRRRSELATPNQTFGALGHESILAIENLEAEIARGFSGAQAVLHRSWPNLRASPKPRAMCPGSGMLCFCSQMLSRAQGQIEPEGKHVATVFIPAEESQIWSGGHRRAVPRAGRPGWLPVLLSRAALASADQSHRARVPHRTLAPLDGVAPGWLCSPVQTPPKA
jgi:hypothetical protein